MIDANFCSSAFWDVNLTWETQVPDLTPCFQDTVLVVAPSLLFFFVFEFNLYYSTRKSSSGPLPWTWRNTSKVIICVCLLCISLACFGINLYKKFHGEDISYSSLSATCARSVIFVLILVIMLVHRRYGITTSTVLSLYWLYCTVCGIIMHRSSFLKYYELIPFTISTEIFVLDIIYLPMLFMQLMLACFVDVNRNPHKKGSTFEEESFFSAISFLWFTKIIRKSRQKLLDVTDFTPLITPLKAEYLSEKFQKHFKFQSTREESKTKSLAWALYKAIWTWITWALFLEFVAPCFIILFQPLLLDLIIQFISHDEYIWRGYLYCVALFLACIVFRIIDNSLLFYLQNFKTQLKSVIIGAVYRKTLRMSSSTKRKYTSGALSNLISVDVERILNFVNLSTVLIVCPAKIIITIVLLWQYLGPSCLSGIAAMVVMIPMSLSIARKSKKLTEKQMGIKDNRLKYMNEMLNGIKVLKLYAWEIPFMNRITKTRTQELRYMRGAQLYYIVMRFAFTCAPFIVAIASFATYVLVDANHVLTPSKAFVSLNLMNNLRFELLEIPDATYNWIQANISLGRLRKFFQSEEHDMEIVGNNANRGEALSVRNATFTWELDTKPVLKNIDLSVHMGQFIAIIGAVGAGKSSLFSAILGEMYKASGSIDLKGHVAYVPQQAWILNRTVKQNILLEKPMEEETYNRILNCCCLRPDLKILPASDETEIGEKGVNLSGGQKQRVSLARAVFQDADVYLLDDPLSAVDAHVRKDLIDNVLSNTGLLKGKTRILVTHDISVLPLVDFIVSLKDGEIDEVGEYQDLLGKDGRFAEFIREHGQENHKEEELETNSTKHVVVASRNSAATPIVSDPFDQEENRGNLIEEEKMEIGKVKRGIYMNYIKHAGILYLFVAASSYIGFTSFEVAGNVWLSKWSSDNASLSDASQRQLRLSVYGAFGAAQALCYVFGSIFFVLGSLRAAAAYQKQMLMSIMKSPMYFFETTPSGRIINRFGSDMEAVDTETMHEIQVWFTYTVGVLSTFVIVGINAPIFLVAVIPIGIVYYVVQGVYLKASRQIKRLESTSRSPMYSHFLETIHGVTSVRAFKIQQEFTRKMDQFVDIHISCSFHSTACERWLMIWLDLLGSLVVLVTGILAVQNKDTLAASSVGLMVTYALSVTDSLRFLIQSSTALENKSVSIERLEEYSNLKPEAPWNLSRKDPSNNWPESGSVTFERYSTRYREELDLVLKEINLHIEPHEKVGIVGRTGAGKSSVTLALFRMIEPAEGRILIDRTDISKMGLHELRSNLTIIPQDPVLFTGSLRVNLDPNDEYTDEELWTSLERAHLKNFVSSIEAGLHHDLAEGGENFSVGQRQLLCLARALLKRTKILVLDEATAAVDMDTDALIQASIRTEFKHHTVITIAHRLNTVIDYDKIIVMDNGRIMEFGTPSVLIQDSNSEFYRMAKDAGLITTEVQR